MKRITFIISLLFCVSSFAQTSVPAASANPSYNNFDLNDANCDPRGDQAQDLKQIATVISDQTKLPKDPNAQFRAKEPEAPATQSEKVQLEVLGGKMQPGLGKAKFKRSF